MNNNVDVQLYGYRWVIFVVFFLLNFVMQLHNLTFASITIEAAKLYDVSDLQINLLAMIFMAMFVVLSIPASYLIDRFGIRLAVGFGAVMLAAFGLVKGIFATNYNMVLVAQIGLAIAQPFIVNACTRVSAVWFPIKARATITGFFFMAQYVGIFIALGATPFIASKFEISGMLMIYGITSLVIAVVFLAFIREKPPTPACHEGHEFRISTREGLKQIFGTPSMIIMIIMFFIGLGIFNAISVCLEQIFRSRGFTPDQVGILGMLMIVGGLIGAFFWAYLSDRFMKRKPFIIIAWFSVLPSMAGIAFATNPALVWISAFLFGFILMGIGPLGFQYAAEITYPTPEALSAGMLQLIGQFSGIVFVLGMNSFGDYNQQAVIVFMFLALLNLLICFKLKESTIIKTD